MASHDSDAQLASNRFNLVKKCLLRLLWPSTRNCQRSLLQCTHQHMAWLKESTIRNLFCLTTTDKHSAEGSNHQISDRVTRKESAELSIARMKVSSLEQCWMMLSSMFTKTLEKKNIVNRQGTSMTQWLQMLVFKSDKYFCTNIHCPQCRI